MPGLRRAGRIAGKKWKREHGIDKKTKHMTPEEKVSNDQRQISSSGGQRRSYL